MRVPALSRHPAEIDKHPQHPGGNHERALAPGKRSVATTIPYREPPRLDNHHREGGKPDVRVDVEVKARRVNRHQDRSDDVKRQRRGDRRQRTSADPCGAEFDPCGQSVQNQRDRDRNNGDKDKERHAAIIVEAETARPPGKAHRETVAVAED